MYFQVKNYFKKQTSKHPTNQKLNLLSHVKLKIKYLKFCLCFQTVLIRHVKINFKKIKYILFLNIFYSFKMK
jgi:hypothetical protein